MPDCKQMYFELFRAVSRATELLLTAQRECEELYLRHPEPELRVIDRKRPGESGAAFRHEKKE